MLQTACINVECSRKKACVDMGSKMIGTSVTSQSTCFKNKRKHTTTVDSCHGVFGRAVDEAAWVYMTVMYRGSKGLAAPY